MNRPGTLPQSVRGMPGGFGGQQQPQQQAGRAVNNRLPNGKLVTSGSGWTSFGAMGGSGNMPPGSGRHTTFAQTLGGSQPQTPIDISDFPQLSTPTLSTANQPPMWSGGASRNPGSAVHRGGGTPLSSQTTQQDDYLTAQAAPSRVQPAQGGGFRFGNQGNASQQQSSQQQSSATDEFPPLSRNANGEMSGGNQQDRVTGLMSSLGFGATGSSMQQHASNRGGNNNLLNALSASGRGAAAAADARGSTIGRPQDVRSPVHDDEPRQQKPPGYREDSMTSQHSATEAAAAAVNRNPLGAIGNDAPTASGKAKDEGKSTTGGAQLAAATAEVVQDPLEGMAPIDKFGLKGLRTLMATFPDYNALTCGIDPTSLGLDLNSPELFSTQIYSLFDDIPPRPPVPRFRLPDCYVVKNVQPIEAKIQSFNEETLMWIFYSCPQDVKQQMAAVELTNRNWRWHKKLQIWLTKDDMMVPTPLSPNHERGYYVIWDTTNWRKERREFTLHYADLDTNPGGVGSPIHALGA